MTLNLEDNLKGLVIGIKYRPNFILEDQIGSIVDRIIYSSGSFFNPKVFPLVSGGSGKKILHNEINSDNLKIDNSNIILEIEFGRIFNASDKDKIISHFEKDIIKNIIDYYKIKDIQRIGLVNRYVFQEELLASKFIDKTIGSTLEGINDINLSFSKKLALKEAITKKDVYDYDNVIFNVIKKADLSEIFMSIDFQRYFSPLLESSSDLKFSDFLKRAYEFNRGAFINWIQKNYIEA